MAKQAAQIRRAAFAAALRRCYLFSALSAQDLECVASFVVQKRLAKGDCLFREGTPCIGFYVVDQGAISVHRINASGKMQVIHVFRPAESFAEAALVENRGYPADACALEQTSVLLVLKDPFLDLLQKRPALALRMLGSMSRHLHALVRLIDDLTLKNVQALLVKHNQVIGYEPWYEFPFNKGKLCPKGVKRYLQGSHPDRSVVSIAPDGRQKISRPGARIFPSTRRRTNTVRDASSLRFSC